MKMRESDFRSPEVGISVFWGSFGKGSKNMADRSKLETILTEKENPIAAGSLEMTKFCNREDKLHFKNYYHSLQQSSCSAPCLLIFMLSLQTIPRSFVVA